MTISNVRWSSECPIDSVSARPSQAFIDARVSAALEVMRQRAYQSDLEMESVASHVHISCSRLRHLLTEALGMSPSRYIKTVRLDRARVLLTETFMSVKEIVFDVGATDLSHFVRDFKREYGCTPTEYRVSFYALKTKQSGHFVAVLANAIPMTEGPGKANIAPLE